MKEPPRRPDGGSESPESPESSEPSEPSEPPAPPEDLPGYVTDPLERQSISRLRAISAWAAALADHHENIDVDVEDDDHQNIVSRGYASLDYAVVEKYQTCGDDSCACMDATDTDDLHGPYIYKVKHIGRGDQDWTYYGRVSDRE